MLPSLWRGCARAPEAPPLWPIAHSLTLPPQFLMFDDIDYDDLKAPIGARPPRPPPSPAPLR